MSYEISTKSEQHSNAGSAHLNMLVFFGQLQTESILVAPLNRAGAHRRVRGRAATSLRGRGGGRARIRPLGFAAADVGAQALPGQVAAALEFVWNCAYAA